MTTVKKSSSLSEAILMGFTDTAASAANETVSAFYSGMETFTSELAFAFSPIMEVADASGLRPRQPLRHSKSRTTRETNSFDSSDDEDSGFEAREEPEPYWDASEEISEVTGPSAVGDNTSSVSPSATPSVVTPSVVTPSVVTTSVGTPRVETPSVKLYEGSAKVNLTRDDRIGGRRIQELIKKYEPSSESITQTRDIASADMKDGLESLLNDGLENTAEVFRPRTFRMPLERTGYIVPYEGAPSHNPGQESDRPRNMSLPRNVYRTPLLDDEATIDTRASSKKSNHSLSVSQHRLSATVSSDMQSSDKQQAALPVMGGMDTALQAEVKEINTQILELQHVMVCLSQRNQAKKGKLDRGMTGRSSTHGTTEQLQALVARLERLSERHTELMRTQSQEPRSSPGTARYGMGVADPSAVSEMNGGIATQ